MDILTSLIAGGFSFGRSVLGIIVRPYETYRRIVDHGTLWELPYIAVLLIVYFSFASLVKTAAFRPFLLTKEFVVLSGGAGVGFFVIVATVYLIGSLLSGKGSPKGVLMGWAYSMIPTISWFLATSLLYVLLPPPRTESAAGVAFSILFLIFSVTLFFWKLTLGYLTLRFGMRMDLTKIMVTTMIVAPFLAIYSYIMYRLGIFKVPFL